MSNSDLFAMSSIIISIIALIYAYISNTKKYELNSQYRKEVLCWFSDTTEILIKLKLEAEDYFPNLDRKRDLLASLSTKIEIGRFYFPNVDKGDNFGSEKPYAYRGYRNLILDFLVFSYRLFEKENAINYKDHANLLQRYFTSSLFEIVDPVKFINETKKVTKQTFNRELSFEDFLEKEPELLITYIKDYDLVAHS